MGGRLHSNNRKRVNRLMVLDTRAWAVTDTLFYETVENYVELMAYAGVTDVAPQVYGGNGTVGYTGAITSLWDRSGTAPDGSMQAFVDLCHSAGIKVHGLFATNEVGTGTIAAGYDAWGEGEDFVDVSQAGWADWIASVAVEAPNIVDFDGLMFDYIRTTDSGLSSAEKITYVTAVFNAIYDGVKAAHRNIEISTTTKAWLDEDTDVDNGRRAIQWYNSGRPHTVYQFDYGNNYAPFEYGLPPNMDDIRSAKAAIGSSKDLICMAGVWSVPVEDEVPLSTDAWLPILRALQEDPENHIALFSTDLMNEQMFHTLRTLRLSPYNAI